MAKDPTARLVEDEVPESPVRLDEGALLPERPSGRRCDTPDDDIADLTLGMATDNVDAP